VVNLSELPGRPCSIAAALDVVGDRWSLLAVREVWMGHHRWSEILAGTGAPRDRLAARLKALVDAGVLDRRQYQDSPPRCDYHLTEAGEALVPVLQALRTWGKAYAVSP
jgi:DNA-binding HxlR family transcriptional regulator